MSQWGSHEILVYWIVHVKVCLITVIGFKEKYRLNF